MLNFEHEISDIKDRNLRYFFAYDYFHDGTIHNIQIVDDKSIEITITCYREWEDNYNLGKGFSSSAEGYVDFRSHLFDDKYRYICYFEDCKYYNSEILENGYVFLNGRFKDSAKVRELNNSSRKRYLHFRIQATGGYIDIIFSKFQVRKATGEVRIPKQVSNITLFEHVTKKFNKVDIENIRELARTGDDIDKLFALQYLGYINDPLAVGLAINALKEEDARIASFWILGNYGDTDIVPILFNEWSSAEGLLKRHAQDAIEKIVYRNSANSSWDSNIT